MTTLFGVLIGIVVVLCSMTLTSNVRSLQQFLEVDLSAYQHRSAAIVTWSIGCVGIFVALTSAFGAATATSLVQSVLVGLGFALRDVLSNVFAWFYLWHQPWVQRNAEVTLDYYAFKAIPGRIVTVDTFTTTLQVDKDNNETQVVVIPNRYFLTGMVTYVEQQ